MKGVEEMSERDLCKGCDRQTDPINLFHCQILGHNITEDKCLAIRTGRLDITEELKEKKLKGGERKW